METTRPHVESPAPSGGDVQAVRRLADGFVRIQQEIGKVIVGQKETVESLLIALLARGHCLFVGVPGLAKTLLINTLAQVLDLRFGRVQFTPDLMPADITGTDILEEDHATGRRFFKFIRGPIFSNILLADEINRTPPKTQSALLQAMQEGQVTAGGATYPLEPPFLVLATQNPIEQEGTYPLPEAHLDRFMFELHVDYPSAEEERRIVAETTGLRQASLEKVFHRDDVLGFQELVRRIPVAPNVVDHAVRLVRASRPRDATAADRAREFLAWGAGPRASQFLVLGAKARAALEGRFAAEVGDVRAMAPSVLRHRLIPNYHAEAEGVRAEALVGDLLDAVR